MESIARDLTPCPEKSEKDPATLFGPEEFFSALEQWVR